MLHTPLRMSPSVNQHASAVPFKVENSEAHTCRVRALKCLAKLVMFTHLRYLAAGPADSVR